MKKLEYMTEPELRRLMNAIGADIEATARGLGVEEPLYVAILFDDSKVGQYVFNCERRDVIAALREMADRLARREDVTR